MDVRDNLMSILWNQADQVVHVTVDGLPYEIKPQEIFTVSKTNSLEIKSTDVPVTSFTFNREFYCIQDHDEEVSCKGILFYGYQTLPIVTLPSDEVPKFELLLKVFDEEFQNRDNIQNEMLQMLLKRLIIKITRLAKSQFFDKTAAGEEVELIRQFTMLVDEHFKTHKKVADYADMLFRSPKTIANTFSKAGELSPLQVIHNRVVSEAKRRLLYTDYSVKEIAAQLGYEDDTPFHKLFKKLTKMSPQAFKKSVTGDFGKIRQ